MKSWKSTFHASISVPIIGAGPNLGLLDADFCSRVSRVSADINDKLYEKAVFEKFMRFASQITFICLLSLFFSGCSSARYQPGSKSDSVYDRVIQSGKIRCGYCVYNPGCLKDPATGKLSGIGVDALEVVAKNLGLKARG